MIKIVAHNYLKDGARERFIELARELVAGTRQEEGNISYHLTQDVNDPLHLVFVEEWADREAIKEHNASAHFTTIVPQLHELTAREGQVTLLEEIL